jgi:hypothetical protein
MNPNYLVHRAEHPLTRAEQRAADIRTAELAGSLTAALGRPAGVAAGLSMPLATTGK